MTEASDDSQTGETKLKTVTKVYVHAVDEILHLYTDEGDIDTTTNHPFYVIVRGWVAAGDLAVGDEVYNLDGTTSVVLGSEIEVLDEPVLVYNLEVEDLHSYFVGCVPVLVHNYKTGSNHGNSLQTSKTAQGYMLVDKTTGDILKYGETTLGSKRYSQNYLNSVNAEIRWMKSGTKADMHLWQHQKILDYTYLTGHRPPLNRSFW